MKKWHFKLDTRIPEAVLYKILLGLASMGFWIFGLIPFTRYYLIYQLYLLLWSIGVSIGCYKVMVDGSIGNVQGLNGLVSAITFAAYLGGHLVILLDSWKKRYYRLPMHENFSKLKKTLENEVPHPFKAQAAYRKLCLLTLVFGCLVALLHCVIVWTTFKTKSAAALIDWRSIFSYLAIQFRTLEFMLPMINCNYCIDIVLKNLQQMGECNLQRVFHSPRRLGKNTKSTYRKVLSLHQELEDEQQVEILKLSYTKLYIQFQFLNQAYGWSLLVLIHVYFVDLVCNAYWILLLIIVDEGWDVYALMQSACFAMLAFALVAFLCWLCGEVGLKSRLIGCMISKLVKPLGNKRYNDLVSEFSIQTLHQRFTLTAKEFFTLNLELLGRMVAAIVTYLVILIQFMFHEDKKKGT